MAYGWFSPPVDVMARRGITDSVNNALRAAELLAHHWPDEAKGTPAYREACRACVEAVENDGSPDEARAAFEAAARAAGVLTRGRPGLP